MMKLLVVACLAFAATASARSVVSAPARVGDIWTNCGSSADKFTLKTVTITPDPPRKGQKLAVNATGTLLEALTGGSVHIEVQFHVPVIGWKTVIDQTDDLCKIAPPPGHCPFAAGPYSFGQAADVPGNAPGGEYKGNIKVTDTAGNEVACIDLAFNL